MNWLTRSWKLLASIMGAMAIICAVFGTANMVDTRYAKAVQVEQVSTRLDVKIIQDRIGWVKQQLWEMEDRWSDRFYKETGDYPDSIDELKAFMNDDARERYRELEEELAKLERELDAKATKKGEG